MKYAFASLLKCPSCRSDLKLQVLEERTVQFKTTGKQAEFAALHCPHTQQGSCDECKNKDIVEGTLQCNAPKCKALFPIVGSVPRMLPNSMAQFPEFVSKWKAKLEKENGFKSTRTQSELDREYQQVVRHFQSQWKYWGRLKRSFGRDIDASVNYLLWTMAPPGANKEFFDNKLMLDAGCGHGKFLIGLSQMRAQSVGIDITRAIDLCQDLVGDQANVHLVQGDVIHPPFTEGVFDYVYSSGVIHHTPDTRKAFKSLAKLPHKDGVYSVWVYPFRQKWWELTQGSIRAVTTRMPPRLLKALSYVPVPLLSVPKLRAYSGTNLSNSSWEECAQVVFDFYGPKYQTHHSEEQIQAWFREEGYTDLANGPDPTSVTGRKL